MKSWRQMSICVVAVAVATLAGCGTPGSPLPPSLQLPKRVSDLSVVRFGDHVDIRFHLPEETLDREPLKRIAAITLRQCTDAEAKACVPFRSLATSGRKPGEAVAISADLPARNFVAIFIFNDRQRSAGASNVVFVPLQTAAADARSVHARVAADAVVLTIEGAADRHAIYRVTRRLGGGDRAEEIGETPAIAGEFRDTSFEWEQKYFYEIHTVNRAPAPDGKSVEFESGPPVSVDVITKDVFAPRPPNGLAAVFTPAEAGGLAIDLNWNPNTERDLAGYNVYRAAPGGTFARINAALVLGAAFRDSSVMRNTTYRYAVSAVDLRGNESARSQPAAETVPKQP